jgi:hypothetical protein
MDSVMSTRRKWALGNRFSNKGREQARPGPEVEYANLCLSIKRQQFNGCGVEALIGRNEFGARRVVSGGGLIENDSGIGICHRFAILLMLSNPNGCVS